MQLKMDYCVENEWVICLCYLIFHLCRYGPLVRYWCMRFEGKHAYFKDLAHRVKCFKNIPKTMAYRHQRSTCYYINGSRGSPFYKESKTSPGKLC